MQKKTGNSVVAALLVLALGIMPLPVKAANLEQLVAEWFKLQLGGADLTTPNSGLKGKVIVIDPGHGGSDTGAIGSQKLMEKNVTLAIGKELNNMLTNSGATVIMTRTTDKDVSYPGASDKEELAARVAIANNADADLFVSIHADAFSGLAGGTTTYSYDTKNKLASLVQDNMVAQLKLNNRGVQQNDFYVLKYTKMPAILTEAAFISNSREEKLLMNRNFGKKVAVGIYNGIKQYFAN